MTTNLLENVQLYLLSKYTAWYILAISQKYDFMFSVNYILKNLTLKISLICFFSIIPFREKKSGSPH